MSIGKNINSNVLYMSQTIPATTEVTRDKSVDAYDYAALEQEVGRTIVAHAKNPGDMRLLSAKNALYWEAVRGEAAVLLSLASKEAKASHAKEMVTADRMATVCWRIHDRACGIRWYQSALPFRASTVAEIRARRSEPGEAFSMERIENMMRAVHTASVEHVAELVEQVLLRREASRKTKKTPPQGTSSENNPTS